MALKSREELVAGLAGPVASTPTLFRSDGSIDFDAVRNFIDFVIDAGTSTIMLTYGDSLYSILSDREVAEMTKVAVEHTSGRAIVVAADRIWATPQEIDFAKYVQEIGADVLMVLPPDWATSGTVNTFVEHYSSVAAHIPVMVVTNVFASRPALGLEVIKALRDTVPGVVAVKDDLVGPFARKVGLLVGEQWAFISGGQKQNHLDVHPYGSKGYLSTFIKFKPAITHRYLEALRDQNWEEVRVVIRDYDLPYFDFISKLPGGFNAGLHGTLELFGVGPRWRRRPYHSLTDGEMEQLGDFCRSKGLL